MLQVKCDICGKVVNPNDVVSLTISLRSMSSIFATRIGKNVVGIKDGTYDLCDGCGKTLSKFLNGELGITKV